MTRNNPTTQIKNAIIVLAFLTNSFSINAQNSNTLAQNPAENQLVISGEWLTDERFLLKGPHDWAWNENRLALKFDRSLAGRSNFFSEVWVRNFGLPAIAGSSDLFNKGTVDPVQIEIREAYIQLNNFLFEDLDVKIGRQRIAWGTADKINPGDNLNPYDLEDILDFGRRRGSDAINASYYLSSNFFIQAVYMPFFRPANMPAGLFANALNPEITMPGGIRLAAQSDTIKMPGHNVRESSTFGIRGKAYTSGIDLSLSYLWGYDGLPYVTRNTFFPVDTSGGVGIHSELSFKRTHIIAADFATSIAGAGFWGEAAFIVPDREVVMTSDFSALSPYSPFPGTIDSTLVDKPYFRFIVGGDYIFRDGSYLNIQYLHGFFHERGRENMNDYFLMRYEKKFFRDRLLVAPVGGAFVISDWGKIRNNYTIVYVPQISYLPVDDVELSLSLAIFTGRGEDMFSQFNDYDMFMFRVRYYF